MAAAGLLGNGFATADAYYIHGTSKIASRVRLNLPHADKVIRRCAEHAANSHQRSEIGLARYLVVEGAGVPEARIGRFRGYDSFSRTHRVTKCLPLYADLFPARELWPLPSN
jgi:hypothetical protein